MAVTVSVTAIPKPPRKAEPLGQARRCRQAWRARTSRPAGRCASERRYDLRLEDRSRALCCNASDVGRLRRAAARAARAVRAIFPRGALASDGRSNLSHVARFWPYSFPLRSYIRFALEADVNARHRWVSRSANSGHRAPFHSITSSARASSVGGTSRPSALGGLQVDDQLELARLLHGQVRGFCAFENATGIDADPTPPVRKVGTVAHQPVTLSGLHHRYASTGMLFLNSSSSMFCGVVLLRELTVITFSPSRVGHGERCQRIVKCAALSHITREHSWIGRARMRAGERSPA